MNAAIYQLSMALSSTVCELFKSLGLLGDVFRQWIPKLHLDERRSELNKWPANLILVAYERQLVAGRCTSHDVVGIGRVALHELPERS